MHHADFAKNPQHYVRSFLLIQQDLLRLFEYVEPSDQNSDTFSLKIHELLVRTCIEIEANFTAILLENSYKRRGNLNMRNDFSLVDYSHHLSSYSVKVPLWMGSNNIRRPFHGWKDKSRENWQSLDWYVTYNSSKHERYSAFSTATFHTLLDAISGLVVLLSAQFMGETFSSEPKVLAIGRDYSYDKDPRFDNAIGEFFLVEYPLDWSVEESYGFEWQRDSGKANFVSVFDYNALLC